MSMLNERARMNYSISMHSVHYKRDLSFLDLPVISTNVLELLGSTTWIRID